MWTRKERRERGNDLSLIVKEEEMVFGCRHLQSMLECRLDNNTTQ